MGGPPVALAVISAASAVVGAVDATANATGGADTGVHIGRCNVHYPKEFASEQFAHQGQSIERDIIKFHAEGGIWNNDLAASVTGYVSMDSNPLLGHPDSAHPHVPVNRFILVSFDKSPNSEDMSRGVLTCDIDLWGGSSDIAEGTPEDPWVALHVRGRFDPVGIGDMEYSFKLSLNTHGQIHLSNEHITGTEYAGPGAGEATIINQGDHVLVWMP